MIAASAGILKMRKSLLKLVSRSFHSTRIARIDTKNVEEVRIPVPWGHIAGRWWGDRGIMPVVGIHGLVDNGATFDGLAPLLDVPSFLSLDLPGHGFSSHYPKGIVLHLFDHLQGLRYLLKNHFNWTGLTLLGHSWGGCVWFLYSTLYPDEVSKFVSIDGATYTIVPKEEKSARFVRRVLESHMGFEEKLKNPPPEYELDKLVDLMYESRKEMKLEITREACRALLTRGSLRNPSTGKYFLTRDLRLNSRSLGTPTDDFIQALSHRMKAEVLYIRANKTIIFGSWLEAYQKSVETMRKTAKRMESVQVEGGHHVHLENPSIVAPIINQFLNS